MVSSMHQSCTSTHCSFPSYFEQLITACNTTVAYLMTCVLYFKALLLIVCIHFSLLKMYSVNSIDLHWQIWWGFFFQDLPYSAIISLIFSDYHLLDTPQLLKIISVNIFKIEFKLYQNILIIMQSKLQNDVKIFHKNCVGKEKIVKG